METVVQRRPSVASWLVAVGIYSLTIPPRTMLMRDVPPGSHMDIAVNVVFAMAVLFSHMVWPAAFRTPAAVTIAVIGYVALTVFLVT